MVWKPKEKPLTEEEAIALARKDLAPYWMGVEPMLAGIRGADGRVSAHPLDKEFDKRPWVLLMADLTTYSGQALLKFAREWFDRYSQHGLGFLLLIKPSYKNMNTAKSLQALIGDEALEFPFVLDAGGLLSAAFSSDPSSPRVALLNERKKEFEFGAADWMKKMEVELQKFLRRKDAGLPLLPVYAPAESIVRDVARVELKKGADRSKVVLSGKWDQGEDFVSTSDPNATVRFNSPCSRVSLISSLASSGGEPARVSVELSGAPVFEAVYGEDLVSKDDGGTALMVKSPRFYHALRALPGKSRDVTLRFPDADRLPVAIQAICFGE
jgi:hypothetical protein